MSGGLIARGRPARAVRCAALLATAAVAGCQSASEGVNVFPDASPGSGYVLSNDPGRLARTHLGAGDYAMAQRYFADAVEKDKLNADAWVGLAAAYDNLGRYDLADKAYVQAVSLRGETLEIINNRGYSYLLRGDVRRARSYFLRALALDPGNAVVANNIRLLDEGRRHVRTTNL